MPRYYVEERVFITIYNDLLNLDPLDSIRYVRLGMLWFQTFNIFFIIIYGGKSIRYLVWIVIAKQLI